MKKARISYLRVTIYPLKPPKHEVVHKLELTAHVRGQSSNATFLLLVACGRARLVFLLMATNIVVELTLCNVNPTGKEIGCGAFGRVFEVDYQGTLCAAKEVHALLLQYSQSEERRKITNDFLYECEVWSTIRHPCIVQFLGTLEISCVT